VITKPRERGGHSPRWAAQPGKITIIIHSFIQGLLIVHCLSAAQYLLHTSVFLATLFCGHHGPCVLISRPQREANLSPQFNLFIHPITVYCTIVTFHPEHGFPHAPVYNILFCQFIRIHNRSYFIHPPFFKSSRPLRSLYFPFLSSALLCILCSLLFCDIVLLCVTFLLLCIVLFIVLVLYCVCLCSTC
jgi:hypothetical protein